MSNVVAFLEKLGCEAQWRHASEEEIEQALAEIDIEALMRTAILAKDAAALQALLGQPALIGMLTPQPNPLPEEPEPEEEEEDGDEPKGAAQTLNACAAHPSTSLLPP